MLDTGQVPIGFMRVLFWNTTTSRKDGRNLEKDDVFFGHWICFKFFFVFSQETTIFHGEKPWFPVDFPRPPLIIQGCMWQGEACDPFQEVTGRWGGRVSRDIMGIWWGV